MGVRARQAQPAQRAQAAAVPAPKARQLKKGEKLFDEGEHSRSMYYLKSGMLRIYKKKGNSFIEIATVRSGEIVGELAFLDGNPRSASCEALTSCTLVEIGGDTFAQTLVRMPDWLKLMLKTIVGRLRQASTRVRQLEQASTSYDYSSKDGKRSAHYVYLATHDVLKICSALLLVGSNNAEDAEGGGKEIRTGVLQRYANQIMGVPVSKITTVLDTLAEVGIVSIDENTSEVTLKDPTYLEQFIQYYNEENLKEPSKQHNLTIKGFLICTLINKHMGSIKVDEGTGMAKVNVAKIKDEEAKTLGKEPFRIDEFNEIAELGIASQVTLKSATEVLTTINAKEFLKFYKMQKLVKKIEMVNQSKGSGHKK